MKKSVKMVDEQNQQVKAKLAKLAEDMEQKKSQLKALESLMDNLRALLDIVEVRNATALMDRTLSCLSCLKPIGDLPTDKNHVRGVFDSTDIDDEGTNCLTLGCGHSICKQCFETHSDPASKDSLVFCEDCQS